MKHNRLANVNNVRLQIENEILQLARIWVIACAPLGQRVWWSRVPEDGGESCEPVKSGEPCAKPSAGRFEAQPPERARARHRPHGTGERPE